MISNQIFRNFRSIYNGGIVMEKKNIDWGNIGLLICLLICVM